jgi:hypothetical protein
VTSYRWLTPHALLVNGDTTIARARTHVLGDLIVSVLSAARPDLLGNDRERVRGGVEARITGK